MGGSWLLAVSGWLLVVGICQDQDWQDFRICGIMEALIAFLGML